jgi:hypothetical protein
MLSHATNLASLLAFPLSPLRPLWLSFDFGFLGISVSPW